MVKKSKGFTLVELLAVIVILAVILVIAVPQIMNVITESRKGALASSAKLIASSAETAYISNQTLGIEKDIDCKDISNYTDDDYANCRIKFTDGKAKVTLIGKGKFEGMAVCSGTKENAEVVDECPVPVSFANDKWEVILTAIEEENTSNYHVGDTKTIDLGTLGTHTLRIANKSSDWECCGVDGYSQSACGFVIEFADIIKKEAMNTTNTNVGGWPASAMRTYVNETIYKALVGVIGNAIIDTKVVPSSTSTDKLYLLSPEEVYGSADRYDDSNGKSKQLDYYKENITSSDKSSAVKQFNGTDFIWWLRSSRYVNTGSFFHVNSSGSYNFCEATAEYGVSPAFRLG